MNAKIAAQNHFQGLAEGRPKRERTRAMLVDGAVAAVSRYGFAAASVQDIVRESGVSHGTFYNHFGERDEAMVAAACATIDGFGANITERACQFPAGLPRLVVAIDAIINCAVQAPTRGRLLARMIGHYPEVLDRVRSNLRTDLRAGKRSAKVPVKLSRLLDEQIGALIGVAIKMRLDHRAGPSTNEATCCAIVRLLGVSSTDAESIVAGCLKPCAD